ncbi:MAG: hypothetical protein ABW123_24845 [Cystobacter sp.]
MPRILAGALCLIPALAFGQATGGPLVGTPHVVNNNPGDQTDPRVSGSWVVYTNQPSRNVSEIRYHSLATGEDRAIPTGGAFDSFADIQGSQVVFTRTLATNRVYRFDLNTRGAAEEIAPRPNVDRRSVSVGADLIAWQEQSTVAGAPPAEISVYEQGTDTLTRLTTDTSVDRTPSVSEDGQVVTWSKCATSVDGCDIWAARRFPEGFRVRQLSGSEGEETQPETNGQWVVYVSRWFANGEWESDISWAPVDEGSGPSYRLALPGTDTNPSISGPLIAFEHWEANSPTPNYDIRLFDLRTRTTYRLTDTPASESLSDIHWSPDGHVRVVWAVRQSGEFNLQAYDFRLPTECRQAPGGPSAEAVCASPGTRQLQGLLQVKRGPEGSEAASTEVSGVGTGLVCVDNGEGGSAATSGWVGLGEGVVMDPHDFASGAPLIARRVPLQGSRPLSARVEGPEGSAFRVRLYGPLMCDVASQDATFQPTEVHPGEDVPVEVLAPSLLDGEGADYLVLSGDEGVPLEG